MNQQIIVGTVGITLAGVVSAVTQHKPATPVIIAGYLVGLFASVIDLAGGAASVLAGGIVMVAFVGVLLTVVPWGAITGVVGSGGTAHAGHIITQPAAPR